MKLFLYDHSNETIKDEIELPENLEADFASLIIDFLDKNGVTNEENKLVLAMGYVQKYDFETGIVTIEFTYT